MSFHEEYMDFEEEDFEQKRRYLIVIIYDVVDNKRRYHLAKFLKSYGLRVQRSSFEGIMELKKYNNLIKEIPKYIDANVDLLRIYRLSGGAEIKTWGSIGETDIDDVIII